jgi:aminomethyltransferase
MSSPAPVSAPRRTALFAAHGRAKGRIVEFGGWSMPVFYSSILEEHQAVRTRAGLFDISHMGEFFVEGEDAAAWLNGLLTNDLSRLAVGEGQYTFLLNEAGGVIDDLIVYRVEAEAFLLVVNAAKIEEDLAWLAGRLPMTGVSFRDASDALGGVALQGPASAAILPRALDLKIALPERNRIVAVDWRGHSLWIARTGYTGEDGFEIFFPNAAADLLWDTLLERGGEAGLKPAGLGCRDTLRLESCYPLNGQDLSPEKTPLEAGLGFFVALDKAADFPGKEILRQQKADGLPTRLVALKPLEKSAPPRSHYRVLSGETAVGEVTSGTLSPTLGHGIALAYVGAAHAKTGTRLDLEVRGQRVPVEVVAKPFYKRS